jgi:iron(III) transport system permease protein
VGAAVVGTATAAAVTLFEFPGRRVFEWLLLLPLAMPAYVTAYAYTDFLQFSGPLQVGLRETFGLEGRLLPEVRSLWGAIWVFTFSLYPYVYLLARTALGERAAHLMEAARLLGAPLSRRIREVALPLARPAVAAGRGAGADGNPGRLRRVQLLRHPDLHRRHLQGLAVDGQPHRRRAAGHHAAGPGAGAAVAGAPCRSGACAFTPRAPATRAPPRPSPCRCVVWRVAWPGACVRCRCFMGFRAAGGLHAAPAGADWSVLPWSRFLEWAWNSVRLGGITAGLAVAVALALAFAVRRGPTCSRAAWCGWPVWAMPYRAR